MLVEAQEAFPRLSLPEVMYARSVEWLAAYYTERGNRAAAVVDARISDCETRDDVERLRCAVLDEYAEEGCLPVALLELLRDPPPPSLVT